MRSTVLNQTELNLSRFRYHTGAQPRRLHPDEPCPPLFRDIGFEAMHRFLEGKLERLCGPISPITYLRTAGYVEPYVDYGGTGRLMLLAPERVSPWHSGVESIFIASRSLKVDPETMVFIPAEIPLSEAAVRFADVRSRDELLDAVGPREYSDAWAETRARLSVLIATHAEAERLAAPLRKLFQSADPQQRDLARTAMDRVGLTEQDVCTAWHHLPEERRTLIGASLAELEEVFT